LLKKIRDWVTFKSFQSAQCGLHLEWREALPSTRVIAGAALGGLFVCGLFSGHCIAETASKDPLSKLIHFLHSVEPDTKAKHSSKTGAAAKKPASAKPVSKESPSNRTPELAANEPVIDGDVLRVAAPSDGDIDVAAKGLGPAATPKVVEAVSSETIAPADNSNASAAVVSLAPSSSSGSIPWLLRVVAALSGAMATGFLAWFLIRPNASAEVWARLTDS
jgi:hypothetical protein